MTQVLFVLLVFAGWLWPGCGWESSCDTGEMRCLGETIQTCNADHDWTDWLDCGATGLDCSTDRERCGGYGDIACCD